MRDPKRIDLLCEILKKIWRKYPDLRLGQLILNVIEEDKLYYVEDKDLFLELLQKYITKR